MNKKSDGKCGKGWEPGPGGKCRRARKEGSGTRRPKTPDSPEVIRAKASERRKDMITQGLLSGASIAAIMAASGQTMAGISKGSNPSSVSSNEDWRRKTKDFVSQVQEQVGARDPRVGDQADRWGKKIAREAKEKGFVKRQGKGKVVPFKRKRKDSFRKRLDAPRTKVGGKCGKGWTEGPGDKCVRSSSKSSLTYGQIPFDPGVGGTAKWLAKKTIFGSGDVEYNRRRSLGQGRREAGLHGLGSGIKGHFQDTLLGGGAPLTPGGMVGGSIYRRSRNVGQGRREAGLKGLAAGLAINVPLAIAATKATEYAMQKQSAQQSRRSDAAGKPRCKKGKPCGAICIPKDSDCREGDLYGHETAKYNQEFMAASLMGWVDKSGQPDTSKLKTMRPADRNMLLKAAQDYMSQNFKYDSADADLPSIKQEIESAHGFGVDEIYRIHTRTDGSLVGIGASGGDFFEFDITQRSVGVIERPDLTAAANERARGALAAEGIAYRGDSAFEYLRGREVRMDAPMANGQCGKGWKPGPGGKCVRGKGMGMAAKIGVGLAGAAALGGAAYAGRKQLSEAYLNVRSGAAGSQAKYEARKAMTMAKRAAGKDARRAVKQGVSAVQGAANQAGREVRRAGVMAKRAAGKTVRQAGNVLGRGISEGTAKKVDQAKYEARKVMVQAKRAAGKDARRSAKQGIAAAQGTVAKVDRTAFATAGRVAGKDARQRVTGNVRQAIARDVREINREVGRQRMAGRK